MGTSSSSVRAETVGQRYPRLIKLDACGQWGLWRGPPLLQILACPLVESILLYESICVWFSEHGPELRT